MFSNESKKPFIQANVITKNKQNGSTRIDSKLYANLHFQHGEG
jgi:hypothetical protein